MPQAGAARIRRAWSLGHNAAACWVSVRGKCSAAAARHTAAARESVLGSTWTRACTPWHGVPRATAARPEPQRPANAHAQREIAARRRSCQAARAHSVPCPCWLRAGHGAHVQTQGQLCPTCWCTGERQRVRFGRTGKGGDTHSVPDAASYAPDAWGGGGAREMGARARQPPRHTGAACARAHVPARGGAAVLGATKIGRGGWRGPQQPHGHLWSGGGAGQRRRVRGGCTQAGPPASLPEPATALPPPPHLKTRGAASPPPPRADPT